MWKGNKERLCECSREKKIEKDLIILKREIAAKKSRDTETNSKFNATYNLQYFYILYSSRSLEENQMQNLFFGTRIHYEIIYL